MRSPAFADVLDAELCRLEASSDHRRPAANCRPLIFSNPTFSFARTPYAVFARPAPNASAAVQPLPPSPLRATDPPRREPIVTPGVQCARQALLEGETVAVGQCTAAELRSAFRSLALECHPDRHPGTSDAETARLTRLFASISDKYRRLLADRHSASAVIH